MIDPDKKVEKEKRKHPSTYQSSQHAEHFASEGCEFENVRSDDIISIGEKMNLDKILGHLEKSKKKHKRVAAIISGKIREFIVKYPADTTAEVESGVLGTA